MAVVPNCHGVIINNNRRPTFKRPKSKATNLKSIRIDFRLHNFHAHAHSEFQTPSKFTQEISASQVIHRFLSCASNFQLIKTNEKRTNHKHKHNIDNRPIPVIKTMVDCASLNIRGKTLLKFFGRNKRTAWFPTRNKT